MSKIPYVERDYVGCGLKGECAYLWALFLANEADMADDYVAYDTWKTIVNQLKPMTGKPIPASVYYADLEDAIEKYTVNYIDCSDPPDMDKSGSLEDRQPEWAMSMSGEYVYPESDAQQ